MPFAIPIPQDCEQYKNCILGIFKFNIPAQVSPLQHKQTAFVLETAPAIKYIIGGQG